MNTRPRIVCARTDRAHRFLSLQFHDRLVDKRYVAITEGAPREDSGTIDAPIGRSLRDRKKMAVRTDGDWDGVQGAGELDGVGGVDARLRAAMPDAEFVE